MAIKKISKGVSTKKTASKAAPAVKPTTPAKTTDLPIAAVVRIAKANGAERVGSDAAELLVKQAEAYIGKLTKDAEKLASHAGRKTIKAEDVEMASQH